MSAIRQRFQDVSRSFRIFLPGLRHHQGEIHTLVGVAANDGAHCGVAARLDRSGYVEFLNPRLQEESPARYCIGVLIEEGETMYAAVPRHLLGTRGSDAQDQWLTGLNFDRRCNLSSLAISAIFVCA